MSRHLRPEEICGWAAGEQPAKLAEHVRGCPACRADLARLDGALAGFSRSVHQWSERQASLQPSRAAQPEYRPVFRNIRWAAAALALLLVLSAVFVFRGKKKSAPEFMSADAVLLTEVDTAVSQTVPRSMEPLLRLVSGNGSSSSPGGTKRTGTEVN